ncbi:MAG: aminotransferase class V-fold PLP-dependent enzyme, partial [Selenomonadaceae bacterium]|nr:aminotransferase class V-fold PLP-dependent enzyme [Selenomonadaceae bacterium]
MKRVYNFNPGPATLPLEVLQEAQAEFLNFDSSGMSIIEISHRSAPYEKVHNQAKADILELMNLGDDYDVLFIQGGASLQFAMIPLNFATKEKPGAYVLSGTFASNAYKEAQNLGVGEIAASTKDENFKRVPRQDELKINPNAAYLHIC